jgi:hypothetical protein
MMDGCMRQVTLDEAKARFLDLVEDAIGGVTVLDESRTHGG